MEKKNQIPKYPHLRFPEFTDEWKEVKLGEVAEIIGGGTPSTTMTNYWNGGIVWFNPSEIGKKKYVSNSNRTISHQGLSNSGARLLPKGTVLLTTRATIGEIAIANVECTTNQGFQSVITGCEANNEYVYYFLSTQKEYLLRHSSGSTFRETPSSVIRNLPLDLPSLPEQQKIAALLSLIDKRIEVQNAIIKEQEVAKTSLIRRLFDRTLRFPEFTDEWKECQISDYGTVVTGSTPSTKDVENYEDDGFLWASPADIDGSKFIERTKITLSSKGFNRTRKLPPLSVLVVCIGSIGKIAMAKNEMATNQQINSIVVNPLHSPEFVYYAIISRFRSYLSAVAVQVVPIISKSTFERLPNSTTSLPEQRKIAALLSAVDEQIAVEKEYATLLQKQKAYLLRQMFV